MESLKTLIPAQAAAANQAWPARGAAQRLTIAIHCHGPERTTRESLAANRVRRILYALLGVRG